MKSAGGLITGLSLVFGFLFLALVAELYYLLRRRKRIGNRHSGELEGGGGGGGGGGEDYSAGGKYAAKELLHLVCWKNPSSAAGADSGSDLEQGAAADDGKGVGVGGGGGGGTEESVELELMRLHNLAGPPRFLFTIKEETREDLESEDGKSRAGELSRRVSTTGSLGDVLLTAPFESPRYSLESHHRQGFNYNPNPLFESAAEAELNRLRSSPPPKFKFMRDAEEKLLRQLLAEAEKGSAASGAGAANKVKHQYPALAAEVREGSFLGFLKNRDGGNGIPRLPPSSCSQVTPLDSSPGRV